ncbi:MAG: hypothetical protein QI199_00790, partial [Candidatus Korarchaeota archaeon]|nr:hypothetical protein [Candidatus Korarchaeota archaeon]
SVAAAVVAGIAVYRPLTLTLQATGMNRVAVGHDASSLVIVSYHPVFQASGRGLYTTGVRVELSKGGSAVVGSGQAYPPFYGMVLPPRGARLDVYVLDYNASSQVSGLIPSRDIVPRNEVEALTRILSARSLAHRSTGISWSGTRLVVGMPGPAAAVVLVIRIPLSSTSMRLRASSPNGTLAGASIARALDDALLGRSQFLRYEFVDAVMRSLEVRVEIRSVVSPGTLGLLRSVSLGVAGILVMLVDAARNPDSYEGRWRIFRSLAERLGIAGSSEQRR